MYLFGPNIEDTILTLLLTKGAQSTTGLLENVTREQKCTRQGFYRSLRKLRDSEKVIVHRSQVSINEAWARRLRQVFVKEDSAAIGNFSKLNEGEQLTLSLKGLTAMDRMWSHLFSVIEQEVPKKRALFLYNPHNWSALLRRESDKEHEAVLRQQGRAVYLAIGSGSVLDKEVTKNAGFEHLQYSFNPKLSPTSYIAAIGDYLIEVRFAPKIRKAVDTLFREETDIVSARTKLKKIDPSVGCKIIIERDAKKALQWERRIGNEFFFQKRI